MPRKGTRKCVACERYVEEEYACYIEEFALSYGEGGGLLCDTCYGDDEIVASVHIFEGGGDQEYLGFGEYTTIWGNPEPCDHIDDAYGWTFRYVRTDGWRGYYDEVAPDGWTRLGAYGCILAFSDEDLEEQDGRILKAAKALTLTVARVTARTSNVCSMGYSLYVEGTEEDAARLLEEAKKAA